MNTETTNTQNPKPACGWVCYDGNCPWCVRLARRFERSLGSRGFHLAALQTPWVQRRLSVPGDGPPMEAKVLLADERILGGVSGFLELARHYGWAARLAVLARTPWGSRIFAAAYRLVAIRRPCGTGACTMPRPNRHRAFFELP